MVLTADQLKTEFPEFVYTDSGLVAAKIADAEAMLNAGAFGELYDEAVKYMACHLIALSPSGEFARLDPNAESDGASTTYERQYLKIRRSIIAAMVV